ncbi:hypothetical protein [Vibrio ostreicida]|uniref:hypothetical protein n=1 Tax=Vibrio ostreicida TaxID=526588 RepID=UPI0009705308|nr:hypothetical protein [Vibrio ostreicida]
MMKTITAVLTTFLLISSVAAKGIDCGKLPVWSGSINGLVVNQHNIYCGEAKQDSFGGIGFHSMPNNFAPSTLTSVGAAFDESEFGIYTLRTINLAVGGRTVVKAFSTMFPVSCSVSQINASIVHARIANQGGCESVPWAECGLSAPEDNPSDQYCLGHNGQSFTIATATLPHEPNKISTGFPVNE